MGGILFHPIYWQTACLLQRSGALDDKSADYNKIAKAVSLLKSMNVNIYPLDINKSQRNFELDKTNNTIYFGFDGVKGLKDNSINEILEKRPFVSINDFIGRTSYVDVTSMVTLINCGAFDNLNSREECIDILSKYKADQKLELNGRNLASISDNGLWPRDNEKLILAERVLNFTRYLKLMPSHEIENRGYNPKEYYWLSERAMNFLDSIDFRYDSDILERKTWNIVYNIYMQPMKDYLKIHQKEMVDKYNEILVKAWIDKYFPSDENLAQREIKGMGICFNEHPYTNIEGIDNFNELPIEPEISSFFIGKHGKRIPLYKLTMIAGIVIAKDKLHSSVTLLTANGPVEVKFRKQQFAIYDAQISQQVGDTKKVIEKSWFSRGTGLLVHGMRQDDLFIAKTYKNSPMKHTVYKINKILPELKFEVQKERKQGKSEENKEE